MENPFIDLFDSWLASVFLWREARGESLEAKRAVFWVMVNRANTPARWPNTISGVLTQRNQFSCNNRLDPNVNKFPLRADARGWSAYEECCQVVFAPGADPTGGANHYESLPDNAPRQPWMDQSAITFRSGRFRFYRL